MARIFVQCTLLLALATGAAAPNVCGAISVRRISIALLLVGILLAGARVEAQVVGTVGTLPPAAKAGPAAPKRNTQFPATTMGGASLKYRPGP